MELLGPIELSHLPGSRDEVGVYRELLSRAAPGQEPDEDREVFEARDELLYPHHDDVDGRDAGDEPGVALVGYGGDGPRLGDPEVGPRYTDVRGQELLAQAPAGEGAEASTSGGSASPAVCERTSVMRLRFMCKMGPTMCEGVSPASCAIHSPRSVSTISRSA